MEEEIIEQQKNTAEPAAPAEIAAAKQPNKFGLFLKAAWAKQPFLILMGAALILRVLCVFLFKGYRPEMTNAAAAVKRVFEDGVKYYSNNAGGVDYAPGQLYIFYYIGLFTRWFKLAEGGVWTVFFFKLPNLLADLGIACVIYGFTKKVVNQKTALGIAALYLFNPAVLFAFSIWGGTQAVFIFFLILTFRYVLDKKYLKMCFAYAGAVLFSASALTVAPLLLIALIAVFVKALSAYTGRSQLEKKAPEGVMNMPQYSAVWKAPVGILAFFVSLLLLCLPFTVKGIDAGGKFGLFSFCKLFKELSVGLNFFTSNAFSIYMTKNNAAFDSLHGLMIAMYFVMCAILAAVYIMKRNRANLVLLSAFFYFILAYFMADANPLSAVTGLILLLFACVAVGDRRLFGQYLIFSLVCLLNISAVLISAQYMNNLPDYLLDKTTNTAYGGVAALPKTFMIVGSVIALLSFLYFMYTAMDITVANRRKIFMPFDRENPHYAFDTFRSIFK